MSSQPVPKYHIAPNFSIPPIEAGGILQLGSIIANVESADDEPINKSCHVRIPQAELFCGHQKRFTAKRSWMERGDYGVWAKFIGIGGIGGELNWAPERSTEDVYHFRSLDTIYFNPAYTYMEESMQQQDVKDYFVGSGNNHVYMVTGLKTARGPSVRMHNSFKFKASGELSLNGSANLPVEFGPRFNTSKDTRWDHGFEGSTDFIIGIRVRKLMYKKHWLTRIQNTLLAKEHNKGATMVDDDMEKRVDKIIDFDDDAGSQFERRTECIDGDVNEILWVIG
ncbi:uncharacterized protein TrAtP1_003781 [Trichoderma atroviride]|uniref:uncharacterized protein n=1 Tax=Hypocrea atroviridis TaxID=63577 RepID=UPI003329E401|nr:hypothetical protein TrAtP1_003781 [Trichoderma atroviride]